MEEDLKWVIMCIDYGPRRGTCIYGFTEKEIKYGLCSDTPPPFSMYEYSYVGKTDIQPAEHWLSIEAAYQYERLIQEDPDQDKLTVIEYLFNIDSPEKMDNFFIPSKDMILSFLEIIKGQRGNQKHMNFYRNKRLSRIFAERLNSIYRFYKN